MTGTWSCPLAHSETARLNECTTKSIIGLHCKVSYKREQYRLPAEIVVQKRQTMALKNSTVLKRLIKIRKGCGNGVQKEQGLRVTLCQDEVDVSQSESRENSRSPDVAFERPAAATEDDSMDLEARDVDIFKYFGIPG